MADDTPLTPERLAELMERLEAVMTEAKRLRRELTKQLNDQRRGVQQKITRTRSRGAQPRTTPKPK